MSEKTKKVPKLRFPEFTDTWEQCKLGDLTNYFSSNLTNSDIEKNGEYDLYDANEVVGKTGKYMSEEYYISIVKDGAGVGRIRLMKPNTSILSTMGALIPNKINELFIYSYLENINFEKYITGVTIPHIYYKDYKNEILYCTSLEEQKKIGNFFKAFDDLITIHQCKKYNNECYFYNQILLPLIIIL